MSELMLGEINLDLVDAETRVKVEAMIEASTRQKMIEKTGHTIGLWNDGKWHVNFFAYGKRFQKKGSKKECEDFLIDYYTEYIAKPSITIEDSFEAFLSRKTLANPATLEKYRQCFDRHFSDEIKKRPIEEFVYKDLEDLARGIMEQGIRKKAFNNFAIVINGIWEAAADVYNMEDKVLEPRRSMAKVRRVLGNNFIDSVIEVNDVDRTDTVFTEEETMQVIDRLMQEGDAVALGVVLLFYSGLREGELAVLRKSNISSDRQKIYVKHSESRANNIYSEGWPKWKKQRVVYLPDVAIPIIERLFELSNPDSDFLFSDKEYTRQEWFRARRFFVRLEKVQKQLGYEEIRSPHDVRRTYDSLLEKAGVPLAFRFSQMGHSLKIGIDKHYLRDLTTEDQKIEYLNKAFSIS